ncbi:GerMN domain-containing protein [Paenarthrobacter sp. AR 02]|uniref:GerMN domain-containing protein n=1 Tax=Paenarthrobacter sp. AR 02 TaxID=2899821 RepID=UPI001F3211EA|nr:GerMN domain-containing protein [Paenarthrobacter sp. AR 02]MCF3140593.1 GerMN domain-containing protein [Paenarthrobacter sp. AR 02]
MDGQERGAVMHAGRGLKGTTTIAAACVALALWVAGCTTGPGTLPRQSAEPLPTVSVTPPPRPASPVAPASPGPSFSSVPAMPSVAIPSASLAPARPVTATPPSPTPAVSTPAAAATGPGSAVAPSTDPATPLPVPLPSNRAARVPDDVDAAGPAVYYVAINDGGARGVRFGCNDSLVPVRGATTPGDPLSVTLGRLLEGGLPVDGDATLYDALAGSSLHFLSGYMSGSTVVVNLSGSLRPGGVCDVPRIQAQLTHTAVAASGASRAEIYVNGRTLTEALSVR